MGLLSVPAREVEIVVCGHVGQEFRFRHELVIHAASSGEESLVVVGDALESAEAVEESVQRGRMVVDKREAYK